MALDYPDFGLDEPNPSKYITDAMWWFWLRLRELEPTTQLSGIYANKSGFHNTGRANKQNWPNNYSIRDEPNHTGPWWLDFASALDWTFPEAHNKDYGRISKYSQRLIASGKDASDPRLDLVMYAFFGQADSDSTVEGWNEYREEAVSSDPSHLWHIHFEIFRNACGDFWALWALLTVLMGWSVAQWQASLSGGDEMFCRKGDKNDKVLVMQVMIVNTGNRVGPSADPYADCDGEFGNNTAAGLSATVGGSGDVYGPWQYAALHRKQALPGPKGEPGPQGPQGIPGDLAGKTIILTGTVNSVS